MYQVMPNWYCCPICEKARLEQVAKQPKQKLEPQELKVVPDF